MVSTVYPRLARAPRGSFFLFGPRGTGKSTWLKTTFPEARVITLLDERVYQSYLADIGRFARELRAVERGRLIVVDEIQRLPNLLNEVHRAIEEQGLRFALSGSSARKLRGAGVNLLAGRAVRREMWPFLPEELGADFSLDRVLQTGSLPVVWMSDEPEETLEAYVTTYLREEIQAEAVVRNLPGFARFLPVAALFHGQLINTSTLARDAEVARTTVNGYVEILQDTLIAFLLPGYEAKLRVKERRHPKLYFVDAGLVRALKRSSGPVLPEEQGALFEGWMVALVRAYQSYRKICDDMSYWAASESEHMEVDLVLRQGKDLIAIEVKSSVRIKPEHLKGLRAFASVANVRRRLIVYRGAAHERTADGIDIVPATYFAEMLANAKL